MKWYNWILAFTWEILQSIVALVSAIVLKVTKTPTNLGTGMWFRHHNNFLTCWSLGEFLFFKYDYYTYSDLTTVKHEYGHTKQSRILGPLYLILIALPSVIWNLLSRFIPWCSEHYYDTPWEHWADVLGGVKR